MRSLHAAFVLCALALPAAAEAPKKTPLDDYLAKVDPTYAWKLVKTIPGDGVTSYVLDLKSQTWRSAPEVDRPVWQHWLTITRPDKVTSDTALLSIGGERIHRHHRLREVVRAVFVELDLRVERLLADRNREPAGAHDAFD